MGIESQGIFKGQIEANDLTQFSGFSYNQLDFGQPGQFNVKLSGIPYLHVLKLPIFMQNMLRNDKYTKIINTAIWILENKFMGLDGIEDITSETQPIENGYESVNIITKVIKPTATTVTMEFDEMVGGPLTKFSELFLRGISDFETHYTHHNLSDNERPSPPDISKEIFEMLYYITDRTGYNIEKAYILGMGQLTKVPYSIDNNPKRGEIQKVNISLEMNCVPFTDPRITALAQKHVDTIAKIRNANGISAYTVPESVKLNRGYVRDIKGDKKYNS